jgi:hypothetical protein
MVPRILLSLSSGRSHRAGPVGPCGLALAGAASLRGVRGADLLVSNSETFPLDTSPRISYMGKIPLSKDAFARVLLKAERERFSPVQPYTVPAGGLGNDPSGA